MARKGLTLTPQEQKMVDYHRNTIRGGGVGMDQEGRPVTIYTNTIPVDEKRENGPHANVPGYVGGKIRSRDELQQLFKDEIAEGKWPVYKSGKVADKRAKEIHQVMDDEVGEAEAVLKKSKNPNKVTAYKKGGAVKSASARADGCAIRGKTRA